MNDNLIFPDQPTTSPLTLQRAVRDLVGQLNDGATAVLVLSVALASGANSIRHNLPSAPRALSLTPHSNVAWYQTAAPDDEFLYVTTAGVLTADLFVWL